MHKKAIYIWAVIFAGLMVTSVAVASLQPLEKEHKLVIKNLGHCIAGMEMSKAKMLNPIIRSSTTGILDGTPLYLGYTPTVATDTSN
ncbi:MAG TPA: hypothetical protein ENI44_02725, partial [Thermoplasmatales archaeon]|nr:hypothetical protein [Thermoplasmatales archaeon]